MDLNLSSKTRPEIKKDSSGIALFMVIACVSVLAILVTEFTYIAQINQMIAFGGLDQAKAHYLAKSGLKISFLRLKAFQQATTLAQRLTSQIPGAAAGGKSLVPASLLQKIWSFPFFYPIPTNIPGLSPMDKEVISKFQKESSLEGTFSTLIESESSKYNLNSLLPGVTPVPTPTPSSIGTTGTVPSTPVPAGVPTPATTYSPQDAQQNLTNYIQNLINQKSEIDPDFATNYRDLRVNELVDVMASWADRTHERRTASNQDPVQMKRAPFYSLSELHSLSLMDDELYNFLAPSFTVSNTSGININTMPEPVLRALLPLLTIEESKNFFKFRDAAEVDNMFSDADSFYKYIMQFCNAYRTQDAIDRLKADLAKRNIQLVTNETEFKITVQAQVNTATRTIEAWVSLLPASPNPTSTQTPPGTPPPAIGNPLGNPNPTPSGIPPLTNPGIRINYMRIL